MNEFENFIKKINSKEDINQDELIEIQSLLYGFFMNKMEKLLESKDIDKQWEFILSEVEKFISEQKKINLVLEKNKVYSQNKNGLIKKTSFELGELVSSIFEIEKTDKYFNLLKIYYMKYEKIKILAIYDHLNKDY